MMSKIKMKTAIASAAIGLSVISAGVLIASPDNKDKSATLETTEVISECKGKMLTEKGRCYSILTALLDVAGDTNAPAEANDKEDADKDGINDEYNDLLKHLTTDQDIGIRAAIVDWSLQKDPIGVITDLGIDPSLQVANSDYYDKD